MVMPSQCNNMFIFPGLGLGASVAGAARITDETLYASALALAGCLTPQERQRGQVSEKKKNCTRARHGSSL